MKIRKIVASSLLAFVGLAVVAPTVASAAPYHHNKPKHKVCHWDKHHHHRSCHWVR